VPSQRVSHLHPGLVFHLPPTKDWDLFAVRLRTRHQHHRIHYYLLHPRTVSFVPSRLYRHLPSSYSWALPDLHLHSLAYS
jgi:hypothetical protein